MFKKLTALGLMVVAVVVAVVCFAGCENVDKYDFHGNPQYFFKQYLFLNSGETASLNIKEIYKNSGINISSYELYSASKSVVTINKNKVTARGSGLAEIGCRLYDKSAKKRYNSIIAGVYVTDEANMTHIATAQQLADIKDDLNGHYILSLDIDLEEWGEWTPIGTNTENTENAESTENNDFNFSDFKGIFINPYGFTIKNLRITSDVFYAGLFASIKGGYVDGLILENVYIDNSSSMERLRIAGGIAASLDLRSAVRNCVVQGSVTSWDEAGGIIGDVCEATINGCAFIGNVTARYDNSTAGGIAGYVYGEVSVVDCLAAGDVDACGWAGGIIGQVSHSNSPISIFGIRSNKFVGNLLNASHKGKIFC